MDNKVFNSALSNFITDAAAGGAVRHLSDMGYSISDIFDSLDYPLPKERIGQIMWEHFLNTGKICLEEPGDIHERTFFVKEQNELGRVSLRRVSESVDNSDRKYVKCEFGKRLYKKDSDTMLWLQGLRPDDREYIELMPWPLAPAYHELDERIRRIMGL